MSRNGYDSAPDSSPAGSRRKGTMPPPPGSVKGVEKLDKNSEWQTDCLLTEADAGAPSPNRTEGALRADGPANALSMGYQGFVHHGPESTGDDADQRALRLLGVLRSDPAHPVRNPVDMGVDG